MTHAFPNHNGPDTAHLTPEWQSVVSDWSPTLSLPQFVVQLAQAIHENIQQCVSAFLLPTPQVAVLVRSMPPLPSAVHSTTPHLLNAEAQNEDPSLVRAALPDHHVNSTIIFFPATNIAFAEVLVCAPDEVWRTWTQRGQPMHLWNFVGQWASKNYSSSVVHKPKSSTQVLAACVGLIAQWQAPTEMQSLVEKLHDQLTKLGPVRALALTTPQNIFSTYPQQESAAPTKEEDIWIDGGWDENPSIVFSALVQPCGCEEKQEIVSALTILATTFGQSWKHAAELEQWQTKYTDLERISTPVEEEQLQQRLRHEANHDSLTGLPNRKYLHEHLTQILQANNRCAVLFLDLDHFKHINDTLGHDAGDRVLQIFAHRLRKNLRPSDFVARLSGDEFVVVMDNDVQEKTVQQLSERLVEVLKHPMSWNDISLSVGCSIGWCMHPKDEGSPEATPDQLLRHADVALYRAKHNRAQRVEQFSLPESKKWEEELVLQRALRVALSERKVPAQYHPIVDLQWNNVVGYEALAYWVHNGRRFSSEELNILCAEYELSEQLNWNIYEQAIIWATQHTTANQYIALNVPTKYLAPKSFIPKLQGLATTHHLDTHRIRLEMSDRGLVQWGQHTRGVFEELRDAGFSLVLDDFTKGSSSLNSLVLLPVQIVKFVDEPHMGLCAPDGSVHAQQEVVSALLTMCHALHLDVVASEVRDEDRCARLRDMGCRFAQGSLWPAVEMEAQQSL